MQSESSTPAYKRIVLKLSGEALRERGARENISPQIVREIAQRIKEVRDLGVQTSVVIGGGNIWRGLSASHRGMDRTTADYMGMLATVINGLALKSALVEAGVETRVQTRDRNEKCRRALYPRARHPPSRAGARCHFRRRHRQSLFFDRHDRGAARERDSGRHHFEGTRSTAFTTATRTPTRMPSVLTVSRFPMR